MAQRPSQSSAWAAVQVGSAPGIGAVEQMLREDAQQLTGAPHRRGGGRVGHRWGTTEGKIGFHGGKVIVNFVTVEAAHPRSMPSGRSAQMSCPHLAKPFRDLGKAEGMLRW
jgi:hypothetical protein